MQAGIRGRGHIGLTLCVALTGALAAPSSAPAARSVKVVVQGRGDTEGAARAVAAIRGVVTRRLPIVSGVAARVPVTRLAALGADPRVRAVTPDSRVRVAGNTGPDPAASPTPRNVYSQETGVTELRKTAGVAGTGVTVALIDTGIADVADLLGRVLPVHDDRTGQDAPCLNLSGESTCTDSFGHGTFMAGLIAGSGAASLGEYVGAAPNANLVSVKIAGRSGASDVSNVLAAIQWVVSFKDRYGIRVLNLSLGTDGHQSYRFDPLDYAVERAWAAGIVVVVAASNRGPAAGTVSKPGDDPFVITVGAVDDLGTEIRSDDRLPSFSGRGPTAADGLAKPDLVAPGAHVVSTNAPGSTIDTLFPGPLGPGYRRGSGTSMAAAIVSGAVALILEARPAMVPDRVKFALTSTSVPVASDNIMDVGSGLIDAERAALVAPAGLANQGLTRSNGLGILGDLNSLDSVRGTVRVVADDPVGTVVAGARTAQLATWDPWGYVTGDWNGSSWYGSSWYGSSWYGTSWYGSSWFGTSWYGSSWYGTTDATSAYGSSWYGSSWYGAWD
jgi:serine protease AprX